MLRIPVAVTATALVLGLAACSASSDEPGAPAPAAAPTSATHTIGPTDTRSAPVPRVSNGKPRRASLTIPAIGLRKLPVVPYRGAPDDGPGTRIQNGGVAASPHGPRGGTGPGGIGNYIVTAHRTSSTRAFAELPRLRLGARVVVVADGTRYVYRISETRTTSFRSERSLRRQAAAVPGHPRRRPTQAMITLSTCATQEDHARGNYWADEFGNPEHRIEKVGVLRATRPA